MTYGLIFKIFLISLFGVSLSMNLYAYSMNYVSATFASASLNTIPALTFVIAVAFGFESFSTIKIAGSAISLSGAMVFAFVKGPRLDWLSGSSISHTKEKSTVAGCLLMLSANTVWAGWFVMQGFWESIELDKHMPLIAMVSTQVVYAAMFLLSKAAISSGMKPCVFVVYRQGLATIALAPFAYFVDRKKAHPLKFNLLCKIFVVCACGMTMSMNLHYAALSYISATFATAVTNTIPAMVFIIALSTRIERLAIKEKQGWAKILGSILGLSGAMVFTFYKGPYLYLGRENEAHNLIARSYTKEEWVKGSLLLIAANLTWAMWLVMQTPIVTEYPAKLRLTMLQSGISCMLTAIYGAIEERNVSSWKLGWNVHLLSVAYCGIVVSAITYWIQIWVVETKGPVFTAIFSPLALALTAVLSALIFHESLYWGSVLGAAMLVGGLYAFLWGKNKEAQCEAQRKMGPSKVESQLESVITSGPPDDKPNSKT